MLSNGQRLESVIGTSDLKISEFEEYGIKVGKDVLSDSDYVPINTQPTLALLKNQTLPNLAELSWRIGLILAAINFVIIGIAVSGVNPRVGRSANLVFSLFAFVFYYNLLGLGQSWIASGKFTFGWFLAAVHGGALVLGILWLAKGHNNWRWRSLPGARTVSTSTLRKTPT